jgi:hypothetical protein
VAAPALHFIKDRFQFAMTKNDVYQYFEFNLERVLEKKEKKFAQEEWHLMPSVLPV